MIEKIQKKVNQYTKKFWDLWELKGVYVSAVISIIPLIIYCLGYLNLIRENTGNFITYASALVTINGVFLTLIVTLKQSRLFERLKKFFPQHYAYLYEGLKGQIKACIVFIAINLIIAVAGPISNASIALIGMYIWSYFFVNTFFGAFYTLKIVTSLASQEPDKRSVMK
ncbi:hypothetical protein [Planococcus salinarum]|uniref:hypothetical protein n=1 Tax=Planococcus salinarum TaxID=622695 RepID=UPI000E3BA13F|nr:hypothetical protein [Planococcus salinarum]TAA67891.1 hypothetical protein D2909_14310 [Planococcus salinarum]